MLHSSFCSCCILHFVYVSSFILFMLHPSFCLCFILYFVYVASSFCLCFILHFVHVASFILFMLLFHFVLLHVSLCLCCVCYSTTVVSMVNQVNKHVNQELFGIRFCNFVTGLKILNDLNAKRRTMKLNSWTFYLF